MQSLTGDWSGKIIGTNNADIFVELSQDGSKLKGTLRINDPMFGVSLYTIDGTQSGFDLHFALDPVGSGAGPRTHTATVNGRKMVVAVDQMTLGHVSAKAHLIGDTRIEGRWQSSAGTAGTMWLSKATSTIETASKYAGDPSENVVFAMMAISDQDPSLADALGAIKRAATQNGFEAVRVDEIEHSGRITEVVLDKLKTSRFLVCDISTERPNVYYELGYAHALGKPVILAAKHGTKIHFDIADYNVILYKSFADLEARVAARISEALGGVGEAGLPERNQP